jgi:hypothetical protein
MALPLKLISNPPLPQGLIVQVCWLLFIQQLTVSAAPAGQPVTAPMENSAAENRAKKT